MAFHTAGTAEYTLGPELGAIIVSQYEGGTDEKGCYSGQGEAVFRNTNTYSGEFQRGVMDGRGRYTWTADGTVYEGNLSNNELVGTGRYTWSNGSTYEGGIQRGLRDGKGTFTSADGTLVYEGSWKASRRHGHGVQRYGVGTKEVSSYAGNWKDNCRHGKGTMSYASGNTYVGYWVEDRKEGSGAMNWVDRRECYTGEWKAGLQCGYGEHVWIEDRPASSVAIDTQKQMSNVYRGQWLNGMRHGQGTFMYADGSRHTGQWENNKKHGPAVFISDSGRTFEGRFENDAMVGKLDQDQDHPELSSAVKLKIDDLLRSGDEATRAAVVREVERSVLQINSDLKLVYKHYAKPGPTAPRDSTMFTMSIQQFVAFARDCCALAPSTSVTVGEVYRIFFRMRRQHEWELDRSLKRAIEAHGEGSKGGERVEGGGARSEAPGDVLPTAPTTRGPEDGIYDSRRAITFREFVEGVVRLGKVIDVQGGGGGGGVPRPFSQADTNTSTNNPPSTAPASVTPRGPASTTANVTPPSASNYSRAGTAPIEGGETVAGGVGCGGRVGGDDDPTQGQTETNVNDQVKRFVANHLSGLLANLSTEVTTSGAGRGGGRGGRGGGGGGRGRGGGVVAGRQVGGLAGGREGEAGEDGENSMSPSVKDLQEVDEQVNCLYRLYSGPVHVPMTLRGLLRIARDADLRRRAGLTPGDAKKVFKEANAFLQSRDDPDCCTGEAPEGQGGGRPATPSRETGSRGGPSTADSTGVVLTGDVPSTAVDLDLLDQELMPDEFKVVLAGLFELLRVKANNSRNAAKEALALEKPSTHINTEERGGDDDAEGHNNAPQEGQPLAAANTPVAAPQDPNDMAKNPTGAKPDEVGIDEAQAVEEVNLPKYPTSAADEGGEASLEVNPDWLTDLKIFVARVLEWAQEGSAERSRRIGAKPPKRRM